LKKYQSLGLIWVKSEKIKVQGSVCKCAEMQGPIVFDPGAQLQLAI
jgi:hypothetical protein